MTFFCYVPPTKVFCGKRENLVGKVNGFPVNYTEK